MMKLKINFDYIKQLKKISIEITRIRFKWKKIEGLLWNFEKWSMKIKDKG